MLGFTPLSQSAFSEQASSLEALAFMPGTSVSPSVNTLTYLAAANTALNTSALSVSAASLSFNAKAFISFTGTSSLINATDVLYKAPANTTQPPVTATLTSGTLDYQGIAHITPTGAFVICIASDFGDVDAQASITTVGTSSSTEINSFSEVFGKARVTPSSASAYLTIYIGDFADEDAQATAFISPVVAVTNTREVDFSADSNITTDSTSALFNTSTIDATGLAHITFSSILANLYNNLEDPTAVKFPYGDYADDYNRGNTLYVVSYQGSNEVHVVEQDRTVYIQEQQGSNTVYIAA